MTKTKRKFESYKTARESIRGKRGEYHIVQIPRDIEGRFQVEKKLHKKEKDLEKLWKKLNKKNSGRYIGVDL